MFAEFLIALANQLDLEGKFYKADEIDKDFAEFIKLLEEGELDFNTTFSGGSRDPEGPYSNRGSTKSLCDIPGPQ
jgi:hypothetical protein